MRRLVAVVAVVGALALGAVAVAAFNLRRVVQHDRERVLARVARELGRPVAVDRVGIGFRRGLALALHGVRIGEDPAFGTEDFLTAASAYAVVRLWPLARGRVEVRRVVVVEPRVTVVRTADGTNLDSLGRRRRDGTRKRRAGRRPRPSTAREPAAVGLGAFVSVEEGTLRIVDRRAAEPTVTTVAPIDVWLSEPTLTEPIAFRAQASIQTATPGAVQFRGRIGPVGKRPFARDVPVSVMLGVTSDAVGVENLAVEGHVRRDADGRPVATARVSAPSLWLHGVELRNVAADVVEERDVAVLQTIAFQALGGTVQGKGRVDRAGAVPAFTLEATVRGVDLAQAVAVEAPDEAARVRGRLDVDGTLAGSGRDEDAIRRTLAGTLRAVVHDGRLTGVNVADEVLSGLTGVAGLGQLFPSRVRQRYPEIFASDHMHFDEMRADLRIEDARARVESLVVRTKDYAVRGTGTVTFAQRVNLDATLVASEQLTGDVVSVFSGARKLTDGAGRLAVPFRLTGVLPDVRAKVDREFSSRALEDALIGSGLERLLGRDRKRDKAKRPERRREKR